MLIDRSRWDRLIAWPLLWALAFTIPWEKSVMVPGVGTVSRLVGLLALAAGLLAAARRGSWRAPNLALVLAAAFTAWGGLTYVWSIARPATAARVETFAQLFAMLWLVWEFCRTPRRQAALMGAYVGGAAVASAWTILRYAQGHQTYYRRYAAAGFDPNDLGLTLALSIPLALYLALQFRGWLTWACRLAIALALAAILLSVSRTALLAAFLAFSLAAWTWRESDAAQKISAAVLFLFLATGTLYLAPAASRQRLAALPSEVTQGSFHNRSRIWKAGLKVARHHPFGTGAGTFPESVRPWIGTSAFAGEQYVAHNTYLSILAESGLPGFLLFGGMLGTLAVYAWTMPRRQRGLWWAMLAVWMLGVTTLSWEHRKPGWLLFGLIMTEWARSFAGDGK